MVDMNAINKYANKWLSMFCDPNINYLALVERDDCAALGFKMDSGDAFAEKYGNAINDCNELKKIIDDVTDIALLGSAIYSQWRYFNHWAYSGSEILEPNNREWFIVALSRLATLTQK